VAFDQALVLEGGSCQTVPYVYYFYFYRRSSDYSYYQMAAACDWPMDCNRAMST